MLGLAIAEIKMIKDALKFQLPFDMERESLAWQEHQASLKESAQKQQQQKQQETVNAPIVETNHSQFSAASGEHSLNSDNRESGATTGHGQHPLM